MAAEEFGDGREVCNDGVSHVRECGYALFGGFGVACAAGIADEDGDDTEIGGVTACRFDADLEGDAGEDEAADATVAQGELEWRAFEGGHGELVEDGFAGTRLEFGDELKCRRVAKEGRGDLGGVLLALPGHGHAVLERCRSALAEATCGG